MLSPEPSTSALPPQVNKQHDDTVADKISAYYSLAFPNFTYYLQTLTVTIGRRPIPSHNLAAAAVADPSLVDVDLGPLKSVSRLHARIEYEEEEERFVLVVIGRNGAWVDGIWAASGSRVPLGARSQIQIASRVFHFILPPPPEPNDAPSLSPPPSTARERSVSVDITSLSGGSSRQVSPVAVANNVTSTTASNSATTLSASKTTKNSKKRKRPENVQQVPPEKMPPKPLATYGVMCYRAITALGGKATLQDVIQWMIENYDWYRLNVGGPWENSVRHNLSSNKAFRNVAKLSDERTKGFLWGIDPKAEPTLKEQDAKARRAEIDRENKQTASAQPPVSKPGPPPPKPAFTTEPLKTAYRHIHNGASSSNMATSWLKASTSTVTNSSRPAAAAGAHGTLQLTPAHAAAAVPLPVSKPVPQSAPIPMPVIPTQPVSSTSNAYASSSSVVSPQAHTNVSLPIIIAPLPESYHASAAAAAALASSSASAILTTPPMVVHEGTLILDPTVFSHITPERLKEIEQMGAQKALETLQVDVARYLKTKMRSEGGGGRGRGRGKGRGRGSGALQNGRTGTADKGPSKQEDSTPGAEASDATTTVRANGQDNLVPPANEAGGKTRKGQDKAAAIDSASEEPPKKKRKLKDGIDESSMDVDIDIVGT